MRPYFADQDRVAQLRQALEARKGTPFRFGMATPGEGYDCWNLVKDAYGEAGLPTARFSSEGKGSLNWGKFQSQSLLLDFLHSDPECRRRLKRFEPDAPIMAGDLLAIRQGVSANHLAIAADAELAWHVPRGGRVNRTSIKMFKEGKWLHAIYRVMEDTE